MPDNGEGITTGGSTCAATRADGSRCRVRTGLNPASHLCLFHDPERTEQAQEVRIRGGKASHAAPVLRADVLPAPETLDDVVRWASWVAHETAVGALEPRQAGEITKALTALRYGLTARDMAATVSSMRSQLAELKRTLHRRDDD